MKRPGDPGPRTWASDHERARQRAAERLSLPLPAAEAAWLDHHLRTCPSCGRVAAQYEAQRDVLRAMRSIDPPRDLWARTSTALDAVDRELAGIGRPTSAARTSSRQHPVRSLRAIRAERRAWTARQTRGPGIGRLGRGAPRPTASPRWAVPFAGLAAFAIVLATGAGLLIATRPGGLASPAEASPGSSSAARPGATPITIDAAQVAWLTPNQGGGYSLNVAQVEQVCPDEAKQDCAPIDGSAPQTLPAFSAQPGAVVRNPATGALIVVDRAARSGGGSLYVVAMPASFETPVPTVLASFEPPATPVAPPDPTPEPTAERTPEVTSSLEPTASVEPTASPAPTISLEPTASLDPSASMEPTASATPTASGDPSASTEPSASLEPTASAEPSASVEPTASAATPVVTSIPLVAIEPSPTATAAAIAIISNVVLVGESAAYSPDGSMFAFAARPADGSQGPDIYLWRAGDQTAQPITSDHGSIFSGWAGSMILGSRAVTEAAPEPTPAPSEAATPAPSEPPSAAPSDPSPSPTAETPTDQSTGAAAIVAGWAEAIVALGGDQEGETGAARAMLVAATVESTPTPSDSPAPSSSADASASIENSPSPEASAPVDESPSPAVESEAPVVLPETAVPVSFLVDPATGAESPLSATPAWRPVVDPSGRFVVFWAGTLRFDASSLSWVPAAGELFLAPWHAFASPDAVEVPAVPLLAGDASQAPAGAWEARWDADGDHIAIWVADSADPSLGRLNLLAIDASAATLGPPMLLLQDEPALTGFSIGADRLVWATPPGQDGQGSRLQVLAWSGENAGQIVSEPATGNDALIVVQ